MTIYVYFRITRNNIPQRDVRLSYKSRASNDTSPDTTDAKGKAKTKWTDFWENKEVDIYCDGEYKRTIIITDDLEVDIDLARNYKSSGCFPAETNILTPTGYRRITCLGRGDVVLSLAPSTGNLIPQRIIKRLDHSPAQLFAIELDSGKMLHLTDNHRMLSERGYVEVGSLTSGDRLLQPEHGNAWASLKVICRTNRFEPVYNLVVSNTYNFVTEGVVAHSFSRFAAMQMLYWKSADQILSRLADGMSQQSHRRPILPNK